MSEFTPGPYGQYFDEQNKQIVLFDSHSLNRHVAWLPTNGFISFEEVQANAHLISAAPQMYEALLKCYAVLKANIETLPPGLSNEALEDSRLAIMATARGKEEGDQ